MASNIIPASNSLLNLKELRSSLETDGGDVDNTHLHDGADYRENKIDRPAEAK